MSDLYSLIGAAFKESPRQYATPGDLALALDPKTIQTPALDLIDQALVEAFETPDSRLIISMPPQEGKSTRVGVYFLLWILTQRPDTRIAVTSFSDRLAKRNSRQVRNLITTDGPRLGLALSKDLANQNEWQLAGSTGGIYATSVGGQLTGQRADVLVIDDPHKDAKAADSQLQRDEVWDWWTSTASARLAPGAPVILILTRWHADDLAGKFLSAEDGHLWRVVNIPAQADHDPARGEVDPLGRDPGEWLESARQRTPAQWQAIRVRAGSRVWNALYQGRPSSAEGGMFKRAWWTGPEDAPRMYTTPLHVRNPDGSCHVPGGGTLIQSWDMAFKATDTSDYVVGQVWLKRDAHVWLLDQYRARATFTETKAAVLAMTAKWPQAATKLIEDKANGTAVIDSLKGTVSGIIPVTPHESKEARAAAITPHVESGTVHLPANAAFTDALIEECASFPTGAHDDQVDALTQALTRLYLNGMSGNAWLEWAEQKIAERDGGTGV